MTYELKALAIAGLIWAVNFALVAVPANRQMGRKYLWGPRDEQRQPSGVPARLFRSLNNYNEGLLLFAVAVVVVTLGNASSALTQYCAGVFLAARILYIPAYAFGWMPWRSLIWFIGFTVTTVMLLAALLA